ncbi:N-acetyltransferase [Ramlibacter sp. WS9]|uniref:N-acyl amino acid synthase FeeM domain-containing protein n=1 Tax=Ramlibacter sp. WS9 TaxID=1882741 RepID=UPI001E4A3E74|nr:N-acetyltransferase [Ramlibacter sp. WS9]
MFAFEQGGDLIGTVRMVPMGHGLTLTEALCAQLGDAAPALSPVDWEIGRLVLAPEHRADVNALGHCLHLALTYSCARTRVDHYYAACTHVLSRLYRRFEFAAFARDVPLAGTGKAYTLIRGKPAQIAQALEGKLPTLRPQ